MMNSACMESEDMFRSSFKYFKRRSPMPDFSEVINFSLGPSGFLPESMQSLYGIVRIPLFESGMPQLKCLSPVKTWKAYTLLDHPGFFFIVNPFVCGFERYWIKRCLEDYTQPPNRSNLDALLGNPAWEDVWKSSVCAEQFQTTLLDRLHWVTLGIHHNWSTKTYSLDERSVMPSDLCLLTQYIASTLGFDRYLPEAGILNYYRIGSTLAGHTDNSEFNHDAPVISLSFGCSAIFLLGGRTRSTKPVAMFVDSGDIMVMSGQSRLSFHAIPRVMRRADRLQIFNNVAAVEKLPSTCAQCNLEQRGYCACAASKINTRHRQDRFGFDCEQQQKNALLSIGCSKAASAPIDQLPLAHYTHDELTVIIESLDNNIYEEVRSVDWKPFERFLSERRVNLNVRQVFADKNVDVK